MPDNMYTAEQILITLTNMLSVTNVAWTFEEYLYLTRFDFVTGFKNHTISPIRNIHT